MDGSIRVRSFSGSTADEIFFNVMSILKKWPDYLIIRVGINNDTHYRPTEISDEFLKQKNLCTSNICTAKFIYQHQLLELIQQKQHCLYQVYKTVT